jgi:transposase
MKAYALDLRERVVNFIQSGGSKAEAARRFDLARSSVYRYLEAAKTGALAPKTSWGHWRKLDPQKLQAQVKQHPDATLKELQKVFGVSHHAIWVRLGQLGFTLKKLIKYRERNEVQRWLFRRELEKLDDRTVFYLDECGVDHRLYREYGRSPRGERIYQAVAGKRRERTSIIAASQQNKLVAPLVFQGNCNTEVVDVYFEQVLLPVLPPGSVIVLDNGRFHQSPTTQKLVEAAGCQLLFLPTYSPDLNPIEHLWAALKTRLRKDLATAANPFLFIANMSQCYC